MHSTTAVARLHPARRAVARAAPLLLLLLLAPPLVAQQRLTRVLSYEQGLLAPPVWALAQDSAGFLWVGTQAGLLRYDGNRFRPWAPDAITSAVVSIAVSARGEIVALDERGGLFSVAGGGVRRLTPPPGAIERALHLLAFDADGTLWTIRDGRVFIRAAERWRALPASALAGETASQVRASSDGRVLVLTDAGAWSVAGELRKLVSLRSLVDVLPLPGDRLLLLASDGRVLEWRDGATRLLVARRRLAPEPPYPRAIALVRRNGTIWIALDRFLAALTDDGGLEMLGPVEGVQSGGPLLVDREGSVWLGTFTSLMQLPEPDTRLWSELHGLPSHHTRFVRRSEDAVWVSTWQGTGVLWRDSTRWRTQLATGVAGGPMCAAAGGVLWGAADSGIVALRARRVIGSFPPPLVIFGCARASDGGAWLATSRGVWHASSPDRAPRRVPGVPRLAGDSVIESLVEDSQGRLWIANDGTVCHAGAAAALREQPSEWSCRRVGDTGKITSFAEVAPGELWMSTMRAGVLVRDAGGWSPLPSNDRLTTRAVFRIAPSASGGLWLVGHGILERVQRDSSGRWRAVEAPRAWHGLPTVGGEDLLEDADGALWITTSLGAVRVSPRARFGTLPPPPVHLVDARVDDESVPPSEDLELPHERNRLQLDFAALSFRDRSLLRYQLRLSPTAAWTNVDQPSFRWVDLTPGDYRAEVRASLDGVHWSPEPATFAFSVLAPWYRSTAALAAFVAAAMLLLWIAYRLRLAYLLGLERQRTQIAMDLHDEVGSGLGSIGILSGLLATNGLEHGDGRRLAAQIASASEELGGSLDDIIWSLDPRSRTLEELARRLVEHASRLFASDDVELRVALPDEWPDAMLPLALRRTVLLIGLEALHNAARHSGAREVALGLSASGASWELTVADDGVGIPSAPVARTGRGLAGMRRRAGEIGATLDVRSRPRGGTIVVLRFTLGARVWRARWWRRTPTRMIMRLSRRSDARTMKG